MSSGNAAALLQKILANHTLAVVTSTVGIRAEAQEHAGFQSPNGFGQDQEVLVAGLPERRAVAARMLVDDVVADADVHGDRHAEPDRLGSRAARLRVVSQASMLHAP